MQDGYGTGASQSSCRRSRIFECFADDFVGRGDARVDVEVRRCRTGSSCAQWTVRMILASERAPPPSMRTEEVLDDEEIIEADRDVGATMSDRVRRHSGSGAIACVWSLTS